MRHHARHLVAVTLATLALPPTAAVRAQTSAGDLRAFAALRTSHIGALTPLMTPAMLTRQLNGAQLGVRYGLLDEGGVRAHSVAVSGIFVAGLKSSTTITAGVRDADCTGCTPALLLGVAGDMRVVEIGDAVGSGSALSVAVGGELGYAQLKPGSDYAITLGIGVPITLSMRGGEPSGMRVAPYFVPVYGVGQTSTACPTGCEKSGTRWVLGGGIGVWSPGSNISASVGVNQIVLSSAKPVFGVNAVIGGR